MIRKLLHGAVLETVLLNLISEAAEGLHGYAVFLAVQKKYGVRLGASTLYPELALLEQQKLIESSWEIVGGKARRVFRITTKGKRQLTEYSAELKLVVPAVVFR
jgi:PadR family transcriptional regulator, regulatory protein PadR